MALAVVLEVRVEFVAVTHTLPNDMRGAPTVWGMEPRARWGEVAQVTCTFAHEVEKFHRELLAVAAVLV
jgi:hypothetical protein